MGRAEKLGGGVPEHDRLDVNNRPISYQHSLFGNIGGFDCGIDGSQVIDPLPLGGFPQFVGRPPERKSEKRNENGSEVPIFVNDVPSAPRANGNRIGDHESEFWGGFFALFCVVGGLFCLAGLKR
jgi:hypothetical protein